MSKCVSKWVRMWINEWITEWVTQSGKEEEGWVTQKRVKNSVTININDWYNGEVSSDMK